MMVSGWNPVLQMCANKPMLVAEVAQGHRSL